MKQRFIILFAFLLLFNQAKTQTELQFKRPDSLFAYAEKNSVSIKTGEQKQLLAKWQKISAKTGLFNFRMQTNFSMTDNIELPVTYLPGEAFGGEPGTFKEVTTGQKYITNLNFIPQIDIINPVSWAKLKSAKINSELTDVNNLIAKKTLYESLSAIYFNTVSLQKQIIITKNSLKTADTLLKIIQYKYDEGIVRLQDLNDMKANKISTSDKLQQLKKNLENQYYSLKVLCDIPENVSVKINDTLNFDIGFIPELNTDNQLHYRKSFLEAEDLKTKIKETQYMQLPVISLMFYDAWQQNDNEQFFNSSRRWINPKYIGLKVSLPFPNINSYTQTKTTKINHTIAMQNAEHAKIKNESENLQMKSDYEKAYEQAKNVLEIYRLKKENYRLSLNQYNADILSSERLLTAFNDLLYSKLNYSNALANLKYGKIRIDINNTIQ